MDERLQLLIRPLLQTLLVSLLQNMGKNLKNKKTVLPLPYLLLKTRETALGSLSQIIIILHYYEARGEMLPNIVFQLQYIRYRKRHSFLYYGKLLFFIFVKLGKKE